MPIVFGKGIGSMSKYILKRIFMGILTVFVLVTISFFMIHAVPGGPFDADSSDMSEQAYQNLVEQYELDKPIYIQYAKYIGNLLKGDFGESMQYTGTSVSSLISRGIKATASLAMWALIVSIVIGFTLGIISAMKPGSVADHVCMGISTLGISLPNYIVAIGLMYFFALRLKLVNVTGLSTYKDYFLPVIALSLNPIANMTKLVKTSMIESLNQDYITTAKAKGLKKSAVIGIHALKNALTPVVTYIAPLISHLLIGSFVIENMFSIPGIGKILSTSITNRDYTTMTGMVIFYGVSVIVFGLLADLLYVAVDPRVKYE